MHVDITQSWLLVHVARNPEETVSGGPAGVSRFIEIAIQGLSAENSLSIHFMTLPNFSSTLLSPIYDKANESFISSHDLVSLLNEYFILITSL